MSTDIKNAFENLEFSKKLFRGYNPEDVKQKLDELSKQVEQSIDAVQKEKEALILEKVQLEEKNAETERQFMRTRSLLEETEKRLNNELGKAKSVADKEDELRSEENRLKSEYEQKSLRLSQYLLDTEQEKADVIARAEREARCIVTESKEAASKERRSMMEEQERARQKFEADWAQLSRELRQSTEKAAATIQMIKADLDSVSGKLSAAHEALPERGQDETDRRGMPGQAVSEYCKTPFASEESDNAENVLRDWRGSATV